MGAISLSMLTSDSLLSRSEGLDLVEGSSTGFMVASGGVLSEGYGHGRPGVCLGNGQTEAEGVPSVRGRGDALLRRMPPYLTGPESQPHNLSVKSHTTYN